MRSPRGAIPRCAGVPAGPRPAQRRRRDSGPAAGARDGRLSNATHASLLPPARDGRLSNGAHAHLLSPSERPWRAVIASLVLLVAMLPFPLDCFRRAKCCKQFIHQPDGIALGSTALSVEPRHVLWAQTVLFELLVEGLLECICLKASFKLLCNEQGGTPPWGMRPKGNQSEVPMPKKKNELTPEGAQVLTDLRAMQNKLRRRRSAARSGPSETPVPPSLGSDLDQRILDEHPGLSPEELEQIARET